jgi:hypothetical protein
LFSGFLFMLPALTWVISPPYHLYRGTYALTVREKGKWIWSRRIMPVRLLKDQILVPTMITLVIAGIVTGLAVLPHIEPEFGGAKPRHAVFSIDPQGLDNRTRGMLFPDFQHDRSVNETTSLTVLFRTSDWFFVRVPPFDSPNDPSIEIAAHTVLAVRWLD